jgi:hypothetical protein
MDKIEYNKLEFPYISRDLLVGGVVALTFIVLGVITLTNAGGEK